jgi:CBS domain containing-hemolysin-like protein
VVLDGGSNLRDLEAQYDIVLPREEGFETLAGFVMAQLGKIPKPGEQFDYDNRRYTVLQMDGHRIVRVKIENLNQPTSLEQAI